MARRKSEHPTAGELEILKVIWDLGPATVRQIADHIENVPKSGMQSVLKRVQVMEEKGLVKRDDAARPARYRATVGEAKIKRGLVRDLIDRVFGGSMKNLVMHSLSAKKASAEEIESLRRKLDEMDKDR